MLGQECRSLDGLGGEHSPNATMRCLFHCTVRIIHVGISACDALD